MKPDESFAKWSISGISFLIPFGIGIASAIHFGAHVPWAQIFLPVCIYIGLEIGCLLSVYWARKLARTQNKYGPFTLLIGLNGWASCLMIMHYGAKWGIMSRSDDFVLFSIFSAIAVALAWFIIVMFKPRIPPTGF